MGQTILVSEQKEDGTKFVLDFNNSFPVSVACWVAPSDTENMFLYIASEKINDSNIQDAYREMSRRFRANRSQWQWLDPFQIKLVNSSDPLAQAAMNIQRSRRGITCDSLPWYIARWNGHRRCVHISADHFDEGCIVMWSREKMAAQCCYSTIFLI